MQLPVCIGRQTPGHILLRSSFWRDLPLPHQVEQPIQVTALSDGERVNLLKLRRGEFEIQCGGVWLLPWMVPGGHKPGLVSFNLLPLPCFLEVTALKLLI